MRGPPTPPPGSRRAASRTLPRRGARAPVPSRPHCELAGHPFGRHPGRRERRISRRMHDEVDHQDRVLGTHPAPAARLHGQLRHGEALRAAAARGARAGRACARALRDPAGAAEPARLGPGPRHLPPRDRRAPHFRADAGLQPPQLLRAVSERTAPAVSGRARARLRALRGHTREHLYDRPRTVCHGTIDGKIVWNPTIKTFADYWGFEPRVCRP
jgi:hypothetical protein